ncbi:RE1, partial [Symbiodinium sp. CCMP2592]
MQGEFMEAQDLCQAKGRGFNQEAGKPIQARASDLLNEVNLIGCRTQVPNFHGVLHLPLPAREPRGDLGGRRGEQDRWINEPAGRRLSGGGQSDATGKPQGPQEQGASLGARAEGHRQDDGRVQPAPMDLLAEGIQQLQQLHLRRDGHDPELLKGSVELPKLPEPYQDQSAIAFLEWIYEAGQVVGSITDRAAGWWSVNVELAMEAYHRFQAEVPLKKLQVQASESSEVDPERWARLERRVMTLLLSAMTPTIKAEITMLRINRVKDCLFKLYTIFAPGGASERASLIRQLEHIKPEGNVVDLITSLRKWKKLTGRAAEMGVSLPDGSVLLMALEGAIKNVAEGNKDVAFKLNMAKQELRLPYQPSLTAVLTYADHILAELQQVIPFNAKEQGAKLKGMTSDPASPTSSASSPTGKGQGQRAPCKFWLSPEGCRRGAACKFSHVFATKEDKKARCWTCGSTTHRQAECPTKQGGKRSQKGENEKNKPGFPASSPQVATLTAPLPSTATPVTPATTATSTLEHPTAPPTERSPLTTTTTTVDPMATSSGSSSAASTVLFSEQAAGEVRELAEQFLSKIKGLAPMQAQTDGAVMNLELLLRSQGLGESHGMALLDSGASHAYRAPHSKEEASTARKVRVQLADGKTIYLRQNKGGTLLAEEEQGGGTILPLGSLVSSLGCELKWSRKKGLQVRHPVHGILPTKLVGDTPVLREAEALQLIADLEQVELGKLEKQTEEGVLKMIASEEETVTTWIDYAEAFVETGERASLRRMLLDPEAPLQAPLEEDIAALLGVDDKLLLSDEAGAHYLKALPWNRTMRKRLLRTRWIVHLYNGDEQGAEFSRAESDDVTVVRMDIRNNKAFDLRTYTPAVRALMWAAARGQIEGILGGPPRGSESGSMLFRRMMLLWLVAHTGATRECLCSPFFMMEAPTWHPVWTSFSWTRFKEEFRYLRYHAVASKTGVYFMAGTLPISDGLTVEESEIPRLNYPSPESSWPVELKTGLAEAMVQWRNGSRRQREAMMCKLAGPKEMNARDLAYWEKPVADGHVPYDRRCRTCVRAAATGRAHRRCVAPSAYTLGIDIAGRRPTGGRGGGTDAEIDPFEEDRRDAEQPDEEEDEEQKAMNERFKALYKDIGDDIDYQTLPFVVPMKTRTAKEVRSRIQQIYLQLRQQGLPLVRIHSDRGLELMAQETREWMASRDILATTGESQQPQQNGRAEAMVRVFKNRVKLLLRAASLPMSCWPLAAEFHAKRQRDLALGDRSDAALPFGAPVHVKHKRFGQGGRYDLAERWRSGTFVGYSGDVREGRVVRHDDGSYTTAVHIKPYLIDSDDLVNHGPFEMEVEDPVRRVRGKTSLAQLLSNPTTDVDRKAKELMEAELYGMENLVELWETLKVHAKSTTRSTQGDGLQWLVGQYTYGGQCGVTLDSDKFPIATAYMVKAFQTITGTKDFTALLLTEDVGMQIHRDVHNFVGRNNILLPLLPCEDGGGVWVESEPEDYDVTDEWRQLPKGDWRRGRVRDLQPGRPISFNPRKFHQTEKWKGKRLVLTAYTPRTSKMKQPTYDKLVEYGFQPPPLPLRVPDQLQRVVLNMMNVTGNSPAPEAMMFQMNGSQEERSEKAQELSQELQQLQEDVLGRLRERREWLQDFLAEEEILAEEFNTVGEVIREEIKGINEVVRDLIKDVDDQVKDVESRCHNLYLKVANVMDDKEIGDIEEYLVNLKKDLDVTLDVPLEQVKANLSDWIEPMDKELANLGSKTNAIEPRTLTEARRMVNDGSLILIPGKVVFTVKPPAPETKAEKKSAGARWKRKARIVICGNLANQSLSANELYAAGASVEALRLALAIASALGWIAAATDVSAAFLQAEWPANRPTYGVIPPKILVQANLVPENVVFVVRRALYGLRESPALWATHRTKVLKEILVQCAEGCLWLKPLITDGELWLILFKPNGADRPQLKGLLVTYVDDLLYLAKKAIILLLHGKIASIWPCSELEFSDKGLRYLGMELDQDGDNFTLGQEAYVTNLVRLHGLDPQATAGLPCPKEWIQDDEAEGEVENFSAEELTRAQKVTGECLWLAYRTRPDILFVTNYMAAMTAKRPVKVYQVGLKVIAYLNATATLKLKVEAAAEPTQSTAEPTQFTAEPTQFTAEPTQFTAEPTQFTAEPTQFTAEQHEAGFRVELSGFSDASFAPYGGKSFGCSMVMVGRTPVSWKAGRQSMVAMSVCEAELMEGSTCALLVESTQAMLKEILPCVETPSLFIDNMAAHNILNGSSGSWRTRHLRIRHSYVLDQVTNGSLRVVHLPGEDQPADLPTKLHSRARLMHLLSVWNMVGLPELNGTKAVKFMKLGCLFLLMLAVQSLAVSAQKEPLQMTGSGELLMMLLLTCISAVAVWEATKLLYRYAVHQVFGTKRSRRINKLRELAKAAAEAEIEKWVEQDEPPSSESVTRSLRQVLREERESQAHTPRPATKDSTLAPTDDSTAFKTHVYADDPGLLTVKNLKSGLENEGLPVSGLKEDLIRRLAMTMGDETPSSMPDRALMGYAFIKDGNLGMVGSME